MLDTRGNRGRFAARRATCRPTKGSPLHSALLLAVGIAWIGTPTTAVAQAPTGRNVIIFVADGLRAGSVNPNDAPTLSMIRQNGVFFSNSHAIFPTFTTPNGAAIATGHSPGDTGDFSNTIFSGYPILAPQRVNGVFTNLSRGTLTPFVENNPNLGDLNMNIAGSGGFLNEDSLLSVARGAGLNTAAVGKLGPTLIQDVSQGTPVDGVVPPPQTIFVDDSTGRTGGIPLSSAFQAYLTAAGLPTVAPARGANGASGTNTTPGTLVPNSTQQQYFADCVTKAILPKFSNDRKPFVLVFWSRDPDGSQHNQGDSLNKLTPGINGPTSKAAIRNADMDLLQIFNALNALGLSANTDLIITADHGFGTISKQPVDASSKPTASYAATQTYPGVNPNFLPVGFLAIDLAHTLGQPLFDPDNVTNTPAPNNVMYASVDATIGQRPAAGNGLIGGSGRYTTGPADALVVVAANGGSDLIYVPSHDPNLVNQVVSFLLTQDYVSGLFVNDDFNPLPPGTLPMSSINLKGTALTPQPAIVVNFTSFSTDPTNPLLSAVELADSGLQQGQGMHGTLGRHDTFNNVAAIGPDFKAGYVDVNPMGNVDVAPTAAAILGLSLSKPTKLSGRVMTEALVGGPDQLYSTSGITYSTPDPKTGLRTYLAYQQVAGQTYQDSGGFVNRTVGLPVLGGTTGDDKLGPNPSYLALDGGPGNDTLVGTSSSVTMIGGTGADLFVIDPASGTTTIGDFNRGEGDKIGLSSGLTPTALTIRDGGGVNGGSALIYGRRSGHLLAIVPGISAASFRPGDFVSY